MADVATVSVEPIEFIDLGAQRRRIGSRMDEAIRRVVDHGRFILGPEVARRTANLDLPENQLHVRDSLRDAHPLIRLTRDLLNNSRHDDYGAQLGRWHEGSLNIRVSKASGGAPCSSWMHC